MPAEHVDVLIIGAGLSGIGAGCHLTRECPKKSFLILEARNASGGTWDLFRYPGIRSDSDMFTLGYSFKPWTNDKSIADGPDIRAYIREAAAEHGVDKKIRYGIKVKRASWDTATATWTIDAENHVTFANGGMARLLGCPVEEMIGKPITDWIVAEAPGRAGSGSTASQPAYTSWLPGMTNTPCGASRAPNTRAYTATSSARSSTRCT